MFLGALALAAFAATFGIAKLVRHQSAPPGMRLVPGGEFTMGTDSDLGWPDEPGAAVHPRARPARRVVPVRRRILHALPAERQTRVQS